MLKFLVGFVVGLVAALAILGRYEPMEVHNMPGRIDRITGEVCIFTYGQREGPREFKETFGVYPCER